MESQKYETTAQITEPSYRVNIKQSTKGQFTAEFTVRAETMQELKEKLEMTKEYVLNQLKLLNGG